MEVRGRADAAGCDPDAADPSPDAAASCGLDSALPDKEICMSKRRGKAQDR
jgi:hypothetical protein